jgi:antitoxin YefM
MNKRLEILDLPTDVRAIVGECELTGSRTTFERNGRAVAILISFDEYLALRETIAIAADDALRALMEVAEQVANDRVRIPDSVAAFPLSDEERELIAAAYERIDEDPIAGAPLFEPLRGLWSYRTQHLRVVYRIFPEARFIVVMHVGRAAP